MTTHNDLEQLHATFQSEPFLSVTDPGDELPPRPVEKFQDEPLLTEHEPGDEPPPTPMVTSRRSTSWKTLTCLSVGAVLVVGAVVMMGTSGSSNSKEPHMKAKAPQLISSMTNEELAELVQIDSIKWQLALNESPAEVNQTRLELANEIEEWTEQLLREDGVEDDTVPDEDEEEEDYSPVTYDRKLSSDFHQPLACNADLGTAVCTTFDPTLIVPGEIFVVPCGQCYEVSVTDGSEIVFEDGLRIEGQMYFPSTANVVVKSKFIFVLGLLKVDTPLAGKLVKFLLYQENQVSFTASDPDAFCGSGCNMGSKVIAALGGQIDISGEDPACPSWEKLAGLGEPVERPFYAPCDETGTCLSLEIAGDCAESTGHTNNLGKMTVACPVTSTITIPTGDTNELVFTNSAPSDPEPYSVPLDPNDGSPLELTIQSACSNSPGHTNQRGRCILRCPIEPTFTVPSGESETLRFTSITPQQVQIPLPTDDQGTQVSLVTSGACFESAGHTANWGQTVLVIPLDQTVHIPSGNSGHAGLVFRNDATGAEFTATGIMHWAWNGRNMYFFPSSGVTETDVNNAFPTGSTITIFNGPFADTGGDVVIESILHWAWGGTGMYLTPSGYSVETCDQAAIDFNAAFPAGYSMDVDLLEPPPVIENHHFDVDGVHHWAWGGSTIFFFPKDITVDEINAVFPVGSSIDVSYKSLADYDKLVVSSTAASCWGTGTEILVTSSTRFADDQHIVTVTSSDPATGILTLVTPIGEAPITIADSNDFAVEVASLSRRVVFEAESDGGDETIGGHLIIHHTEADQHLEGVEIRNFGQQGRLGRYPVHFHACGDMPGSLVKKNVIRDSNQRGYVIHLSNDVIVEENVAVNVYGHCYFLEASTETGNTFRSNLGANIRIIPTEKLLSSQSGRTETDDSPSVFWISNPENYFYNNVVGGSDRFGYWFETPKSTELLNLGAFENNEAHSCLNFAFTTYSPGWRPSETATIKNIKVYRNNHWGAFLHVTRNIHFDGGLFADNGRKAVMINRGDNTIFDQTVFIASTTNVEPHVHCATTDFVAISLHPGRLYERDHSGTIEGANLNGAEFHGWTPARTGCAAGTTPLEFNTEQVFTEAFIAPHYFNDVYFDESENKLNASNLYELSIHEAAIEIVSDSSTTFSDDGSYGFLVSNEVANMLPSSTCETYTECLQFCSDTCLRTIRVLTDSAVPTDLRMVVSDGSSTFYVDRDIRSGSVSATFSASYVVTLPTGVYDFSFEDDNGTQHWPNYAVPVFQPPPKGCTQFITEESFIMIKPDRSLDDPSCDNLIRNGEFESDVDWWAPLGFTHEWSENEGVDQSGALKMVGRDYDTRHYFVSQQWLDVSCLVEGDQYQIEFSYRNFDINGEEQECDPAVWLDCPSLRLVRSTLNTTSGDFPEFRSERFESDDAYLAGAFNLINATWTVTAEEAESDRMRFIVQGGDNLIIDNVKMTKIIPF